MPKRARARLGAVVWLALAGAASSQEGPRIGTITITSLDIYSPKEAAKGWIYRGANKLHIPTRERIVRKFLLFKEGDPFDPEVLEQTERNLRQLPFLKSATVVAGAPHDGVVDVTVTTQDTWTTELGGNAGSKGGATTYSFNIKERNLFGTGRQVSLEQKQGVERTEKSVEFADPYLFGPYFRSHLLFSDNSDGQEKEAEVQRPFYAINTEWALDVDAHQRRLDEHVYKDGRSYAVFHAELRSALAEYGRALSSSGTEAQRLTLGLEAIDDSFSHLSDRPDDRLPDARDFRYLYAVYAFVQNDFLKLNYVNRDLRYEDFNLGRELSIRLGVSPTLFGVDHTTELVDVELGHGKRLGPMSFVIGTASFITRVDGGLKNATVSAEATYVRKFDTHYKQTFVAHASYDHGYELDRDRQFFADGLNGLRAYRIHAFEGNKRFILNVEQRFFLGREILQVVTPALALFADIGGAVPKERSWRWSDLKSDAGISLRLGVPRSSHFNVLRIDAAYAFSDDPLGRGGFLFSVTSAQSF